MFVGSYVTLSKPAGVQCVAGPAVTSDESARLFLVQRGENKGKKKLGVQFRSTNLRA